MAYVVWRVLMKKYSKVRLGIHRSNHHAAICEVTPSVASAFATKSAKRDCINSSGSDVEMAADRRSSETIDTYAASGVGDDGEEEKEEAYDEAVATESQSCQKQHGRPQESDSSSRAQTDESFAPCTPLSTSSSMSRSVATVIGLETVIVCDDDDECTAASAEFDVESGHPTRNRRSIRATSSSVDDLSRRQTQTSKTAKSIAASSAADVDGGVYRVEVRRSKSKVRTYLKKCKDALIGGTQIAAALHSTNEDNTCPITHYEEARKPKHRRRPAVVAAASSSSWYLDETTDSQSDLVPVRSSASSVRAAEQLVAMPLDTDAVNDVTDADGICRTPDGGVVASSSDTSDEVVGSDLISGVLQISDGNGSSDDRLSQSSDETVICQPIRSGDLAGDGERGGCDDNNLYQDEFEKCSVAHLVDRYLGRLYPDYTSHLRPVLLRQARDLLVCTFYGDLQRFEDRFMAPAAKMLDQIRRNFQGVPPAQGDVSHVDDRSKLILPWPPSWPLSTLASVSLHLGALDESLLRPHDIYVCIRPTSESNPSNEPSGLDSCSPIQLCAVWRSHASLTGVTYHPLDPHRPEALTPVALEMLAEELPHLLQSLLVGVEHAINRVPLDDLTLFHGAGASDPTQMNHLDSTSTMSSAHTKLLMSPLGSPKCGLKRREMINKNKTNNKYALKRMTSKSEMGPGGGAQTQSESPPEPSAQQLITASEPVSNLPLFCLGRSFPHIDSDEESGDDGSAIRAESDLRFPNDVVAPRSIQELSEKLLTSGIYLPGTRDLSGASIITVEAGQLISAGLNCYEIATVLLYYSTIPIKATFTIHTITIDFSQLCVLDLLDNSIQLLHGNMSIVSVLVSHTFELKQPLVDQPLPSSKVKAIYVPVDHLPSHMLTTQIPASCNGSHQHSQHQWRNFFVALEPLKSQCLAAGRRLVSVMGEIRASDHQGVPSRRQLYAQHRALSRALMDPDLQNLRRKGQGNLNKLKETARCIATPSEEADDCSDRIDGEITDVVTSSDDVAVRLGEVISIFDEVDRAARRLEQLTEQRRERLRELTRQRALEDEINEVTTWIKADGDKSLGKFAGLPLESEANIKEHEQDFEKFYFISMKNLAKGQDLIDASVDIDALKAAAQCLKDGLATFSNRLENARDRIEGASRLHHLLGLNLKEDDDIQQEMQKLADKIGDAGLVEKCKDNASKNLSLKTITTSTPNNPTNVQQPRHAIEAPDLTQNDRNDSKDTIPCECWRSPEDNEVELRANSAGNNRMARSLTTELAAAAIKSKRFHAESDDDDDDDEEEDHSKMADSGLGYCERCEGNEKMTRSCSCQSFDEPTNASSKSNHSDDLEEECFEGNLKQMLDFSSPFQPNAHLYCYSSSMDLPELDNNSGLDPKTQKTLLFIMREMIGTERDYVRSLRYIIDNYTEELNREDIPQAMRGQRNVIFGNVEKICEFHQQHFLRELEQCEHNPLKVGAAFLEHEAKFYLYALYNKNKPKSDSLMSEYGTGFFKTKQLELDDKMDLASYLLKPVQRMGKYALLLQQLMKAVTSVQGPSLQTISEDVEELRCAEEMVRFQLRHGNDLLAMDSLRDCDVNVKEQGRLLRQNEFLVWQGRGGKKALRQVFLFEELVLFSKARRFPDRKNLDIYLYKNSVKTSDIGLTAHTGDSPNKFEIWFRKRKPEDTWTLQCISEDVKNAWTEEVSKLLWKQAKRNRDVRLAEMSSMGIGNKPCLDIRPSGNQISDRSITFSQLEKTPKFRNSFSGTLPEIKASRRPNSVISLGSSFSSGTSSSSLSTSASSSGSHSASRNHSNIGLELINETSPLQTSIYARKHQRSTTLISQLSMESGILADISMSPDTELHQLDPQMWPTCIKKTNTSSSLSTTSSNTSSSTSSTKSTTNRSIRPTAKRPTSNNDQSGHHHHHRHHRHHNQAVNGEGININHTNNVSSADQYLNNDSVTVHL